MKTYVLDANIIFSAIISGKDIYQELFSSNRYYVPDFALEELQEHEETLLNKTKIKPEKLKEFTIILFERLIVIPQFLISDNSILKAYGYCQRIDGMDTLYVALSIEFGIPLLTRDKELFKGLKSNGFDNVIMFDEILNTPMKDDI